MNLQDWRYALRMLRKYPIHTATAVLTLAVGIGANAALFSIVNGVLLSPLPYPHDNQLVRVYAAMPGDERSPITYLNFLDWQRNNSTLSSLALYRNIDYNLTGSSEGERLSGYMISANFFSTLDVQPVLGRSFHTDEDQIGAGRVAIISGGLWLRKYGASPSVIGQTLTLNGASYEIVGVIPADFTFYGQSRDVYTPAGQWNDPSFRDRRISVSAHAIGRMKEGVGLAQAQADMDSVAQALAQAFPEADKLMKIKLVPMKDDYVGKVETMLLALLAAVGFLLLIACANVANLLLARSMGRSREFAVRSAIGAGRAQIIRQLLIESLLMAVLGGVAGLAFAYFALKTIVAALPGTLPRVDHAVIDGRVVLFTLLALLASTLVSGLAPAWSASKVDLMEVLKEGGRGSSGPRRAMQGVLVASEVALALVLLVGAGLMIRSLAAMWQVSPGYNPNHAITFNLSLPATTSTTSSETRTRLRRLDAILKAIPGVEAVSVTLGSRPLIHESTAPFWIDGEPKPANQTEMHASLFYLTQEGFKDAMGLSLHAGRFIDSHDDENSPRVIVIDDTFARTYFPNVEPIGKRIHLQEFGVMVEIVGVVNHIKQWGLGAEPPSAIQPQFHYPFMQIPEQIMPLVAGNVGVVMRTSSDPAAAANLVRAAIRQHDPREVLYGMQTLDGMLENSLAARRITMRLLAAFAGIALALAMIGVYGVISHLVGQRTREIGVRVALGGQPADIARLVISQGGKMVLYGLAAGTVLALVMARLIASELFGVTAHDPVTFGVVLTLIALATLMACYLPARRASRIDPVVALQHD